MKKVMLLLRDLIRIRRTADSSTLMRYLKNCFLSAAEIIRTKKLTAADRKMSDLVTFRTPQGRPVVLRGEYFGLARDIFARGSTGLFLALLSEGTTLLST